MTRALSELSPPSGLHVEELLTFAHDPERDAWKTIPGFVYPVDLTFNAGSVS